MANYGDINPTTGKLYTPTEIMRINSGLDPSTGMAGGVTPTTPTTPIGAPTGEGFTMPEPTYPEAIGDPSYDVETGIFIHPQYGFEGSIEEWYTLTGQTGHPEGYTPRVREEGAPTGAPTTPTFGEGAAAGVPTPTVTLAPPYEILPEQQEMMDLLSTTITDWVTSGGYGLSPEIQAQMIQQQTDTLKAREQESIRVMKNNMGRRGITNSGYLQANENMITSNTSVAIAGAIADVQIKSALMKMASFEKAMGAAAQFLGYLSEQSQLAYVPEFATWQAEQLTKMQVWQGKLDVYKMELNQSYQTQNMTLQAQLTSQLNQEQHQFDLELAEMEIEANNKIAMAQGIGGIFGTILGFLFGK